MARKLNGALCFLLTVIWATGSAIALGQAADFPQPLSRIVQPISEARLVLLKGNTRPEIQSGTDLGRVGLQLPMPRMMLLLKRSPAEEKALAEFNARQLDPGSPDFHRWLTPEEFGALYGPSDDDIKAVTDWLQNRGFTVDNVSKGRVFIEFSGTAGLVQQAFHTEIHRYMVQGEKHIANRTDPSIPEAIAPVVAGVVSLNSFLAKPLHTNGGRFRRDSKIGKWVPAIDDTGIRTRRDVSKSGSTFQLVSPYDFAAVYNVLPLWRAGIDGTGQTIAIAGRSDINLSDVASFQSAFVLPAKVPTVIVNGIDPGIPSADDKIENTLDVEWSGAVAKGATIELVVTASTASTDGAFNSAAYIIDNNLAPVLTFNYGACELAFGASANAAINSLWQQGATQGITIVVASGIRGSEDCGNSGTTPNGATHGVGVSGAASTPYNVAVGGTDLNWYEIDNSGATYWNSTNAANGSSAKGYMPEVPWSASFLGDNVDLDPIEVVGRTGGISACTTPGGTAPANCSGGYAKPSWQTGMGIPADSKRDVPDVSLFASAGTLLSAYVICDSYTAPCNPSNGDDGLMNAVGGTSVSSSAMAGIMALVNQKMGTAQGNANAAFYALADRDTWSNCNSSYVGNGSACNFYDITADNNAVPTLISPNSVVDHIGKAEGTFNGYKSTVGYDLATGLGSINANNLVSNWPLVTAAARKKPTATTGAASSITAATARISASVNPNGADTHSVFAWGTSSTLSGAAKTVNVDLGSGKTAVSVNANLTGLAAKTKYFYRVQATNSAGTTNGAIKSFTTTATTVTKPTATTGAASSITAATATVSALVNPNGADTHSVFAWGTSSTLSGATKTANVDLGSGKTAVSVNANLTGLTSGTKYYYQVQATNSAGATIGAIRSFTTTAAGWSGQMQCKKTDTGPSYVNNETQTWTVAPGISQAPTGQTIYPTQWKSTGSGGSASQSWVINASGTGKLAVFVNSSGINFARNNAEIVFPDGYIATPLPDYAEFEYQWSPFGTSNVNATRVQGSTSVTSPTCDSPVQPGGSSCTVTCTWDFNKQ
jgi:Pro-kumamolisin, activation domain